MGMAFAHTAAARGIDAVGINPAGLALPSPGTVQLALFPVAVHAGSEFLTYGLYTEYFTGIDTDTGRVGRTLSDTDKERILAGFTEDAPHMRLDAEARLLGASLRLSGIGAFALTMTDVASVSADMPRDLARFVLYGNTPGSDYTFDAASLRAVWHREYALTYAGAVPGLRGAAAGLSLKLVHGFGAYEVDRMNVRLATDQMGVLTGDVDVRYRSAGGLSLDGGPELFPGPAGSGFGVDAGFTMQAGSALTLGVAVMDLGSIRWTGSVRETVADTVLVVDEPLREDQRRAIEQVLEGRTQEGGSFSTPLPGRIRLGAAMRVDQLIGMPGELLVCADLEQGFRAGAAGTLTPRAALGAEYRPVHWLPLRTGVSAGGTDGVNLGLGFGVDLDTVELAVASENATWILQSGEFSWWSLAAGLTLRF